MSKPTQPQLPLSGNGQLGLRRHRRVCGFCGFNVTINKDRTMRMHGPKGNRCVGSGVPWTPSFHTSRRNGGIIKQWGTCGICGDVSEFPDAKSKTDRDLAVRWMKLHDHERPRIYKDRESGKWRVKVVNHRTGKSLTIDADTHDDARTRAVELVELQK